jgi:hypothetical protein
MPRKKLDFEHPERIWRWRREGVSFKKMGRRLGCDYHTVQRWLVDHPEPPAETVSAPPVERPDPRSWGWTPPPPTLLTYDEALEKDADGNAVRARRSDGTVWTAPSRAAQPVASPAEPPPVKLPLPAMRLEAMRYCQQRDGTSGLRKEYSAQEVEQFLASRWNIYPCSTRVTTAALPTDLATVAANHTHRGCSCDICGRLVNGGYRFLVDDDHPNGAWLKLTEPRPPKPVPPAEPTEPPELPPHAMPCFCQTCRAVRLRLVQANWFWSLEFKAFVFGGSHEPR